MHAPMPSTGRATSSRFSGRRARAILLVAFVSAVALVQSAAVAVVDPADPYAVFEHCPVEALVEDGHPDGSCITAVISGGTFQIGKGTVPVTAPSTLSEGEYAEPDGDLVTVAPTDGALFESSPMRVPGGLFGVDGLEKLLPGLARVTATVELATTEAPPIDVFNAIYGTGDVVVLPIKIKLRNPLLGNRCYIGSDADPIVLRLRTGTTNPPAPNQPITGDRGTFNFVLGPNGGSLVEQSGATLVDNAFSVPGATGCGLLGSLDKIVNQRQGLPAPAGTNSAVLEGSSYLGGPASAILASR